LTGAVPQPLNYIVMQVVVLLHFVSIYNFYGCLFFHFKTFEVNFEIFAVVFHFEIFEVF